MPVVKGYIEITFRFAKDGGQWTAECIELGTAAYGNNIQEALEAISDLVLLHLNALENIGTRKAFFRKHGIRFHPGKAPQHQAPRELPIRLGEFVHRHLQPVAMAGAS